MSDTHYIERRMTRRQSDRDTLEYEGCPKYLKHDLTDEQLLIIVDKAIEVFLERQDREIGRLTKKGFVYIIGATVTGVFLWLQARGFIKIL